VVLTPEVSRVISSSANRLTIAFSYISVAHYSSSISCCYVILVAARLSHIQKLLRWVICLMTLSVSRPCSGNFMWMWTISGLKLMGENIYSTRKICSNAISSTANPPVDNPGQNLLFNCCVLHIWQSFYVSDSTNVILYKQVKSVALHFQYKIQHRIS
jgi:hypothetical protein